MAETIKLLKGLKANLPSSGATPGAMYCCTDTGGIYIANSSGVPQIIANIDTGATSTGSSGSGNAVTSLSYNTSTRKLTYNLGNSFLPLAGGTITGKIDLTTAPNADDGQKMGKTSGASGGIHFRKKGTNDEGNAITWSYAENNEAHAGIYVKSSGSYGTKMYLATTNSFNDGAKAALEIDHTGAIKALRSNFIGNLTGNADTATKFAVAQTVALTGDVTGSVSSQAGWSIATTLKNSGVSEGAYGPSKSVSLDHGKGFEVPYFTVDTKGRVTYASTRTITLPGINNATISVVAGKGLTDGGSFTTNQSSAGTITLNVGAGAGISVTDNAVSLAASGVEATSYGPSADASPAHGDKFSVPYFTTDMYGRITHAATKTITLPTYSLSSFGITATAAELNKMDGITATTTELNYVDGVVSSIQMQLDSKLPLSGGTMVGSIITPKDDNKGIIPLENNYGQIGSSDKKFYRMYATTFHGNLSGNSTSTDALKAQTQLTTADEMNEFLTASKVQYTTFKLTEDTQNLGFGSNDGMLISIPWGSTDYGAQMAFDDSINGNIAVRGKAQSWGNWYKLIHSGNIGSQSVNYATSAGSASSATTASKCTGNAATATNVAWSGVTSKPSYYDAKAIKSIARNGTTFTYTCMDGTTGTFTQQDNNTTYSPATTSANGLMSSGDKTKLNGIATGAEVNQNAFSNITIGSTTIAAESKTDTLTFVAGSNITLTPDATNDKITIAATNTTYNAASQSTAGLMSAADKQKLDGIATGANNYTYTLPAATSSALGGVKIGSNITNSSGTISLTKANVTAALGYTPPTADTNTHYTTKLFATSSSGTAHAATTNGNTYLRLFDDSTARQSIKITGSGATTVSSDGSGTITISSTDTKNAGTITAVQANGTNVATSGVANIPAASTSVYGVTKLSSATNSTSTTLAATASAVKAAYDLANSKAPGYTYGTTDLTAGVSELATGTLYFVYE